MVEVEVIKMVDIEIWLQFDYRTSRMGGPNKVILLYLYDNTINNKWWCAVREPPSIPIIVILIQIAMDDVYIYLEMTYRNEWKTPYIKLKWVQLNSLCPVSSTISK